MPKSTKSKPKEIKTPVEELFRLLWDTPKDKDAWFTIRKQMMEKEKEVIIDAVNKTNSQIKLDKDKSGFISQNGEGYYNDTFDNQKF
jgi:hypothetical protein